MRQTKPKLTTVAYAERFEAETVAQQRRYCDAFETWRGCKGGACRRDRACRGEVRACLKRALGTVPREVQWQAREKILAATPKNFGGPERQARLCMPRDFFDGTADRYRHRRAQAAAQGRQDRPRRRQCSYAAASARRGWAVKLSAAARLRAQARVAPPPQQIGQENEAAADREQDGQCKLEQDRFRRGDRGEHDRGPRRHRPPARQPMRAVPDLVVWRASTACGCRS